MRRIAEAAILSIGGLVASAAHAEDDARRRAQPKIETARNTYFVGERFTITLRVEGDPEWLREHALQTSRRVLDIPISVESPWVRAAAGVLEYVPPTGPERTKGRVTIALDDAVATAVAGAEALVVTRHFVAKRAGPVTLAAPVVRFEYAERFEDDLVHGRVPIDRRRAAVEGETLVLTILELPTEDRPPGFSGGIGGFGMTATADRSEVVVGEHVTLRLRITGDGNLAALDPPRLDTLPGFHVVGVLDDRGAATRTVTYELAPLAASVREIPPIELHYFDPAPPAAYRAVQTVPIPLTVRLRPGEAEAPIAGPQSAATEAPTSWRTLVVIAVGVAIATALVVALRRRAKPAAADPVRERALGAASAFRAASAQDPGDALADYLASRLGCTPAAVIAPELPQRLVHAGVGQPLADRTAVLLERLVASRYGGGADPADLSEARSLVEELERAFGTAGPR